MGLGAMGLVRDGSRSLARQPSRFFLSAAEALLMLAAEVVLADEVVLCKELDLAARARPSRGHREDLPEM